MADLELHDEIVEWTESLDDDEWDRTIIVIDRLVALGSTARMPLSKSLGEGLFELRFTLGPTARRITYRFTKNGRIVLPTTFRKHATMNAPRLLGPAGPRRTAPGSTREGDHDGELLPLG